MSKSKDWLKKIMDEIDRIIGSDFDLIGDAEWQDPEPGNPDSYVRFEFGEVYWFAPAARSLRWLKEQPEQNEDELIDSAENSGIFLAED